VNKSIGHVPPFLPLLNNKKVGYMAGGPKISNIFG
jgi:hypothetical protein